MNRPILTAYWGGYFKETLLQPQTLDMTPSYITHVILAFVGPLPNSTVETTFLCSKHSKKKIKQWIKICHQKGIKVFFSILDTPSVHWNQIDIKIFALNLKEVMDEWSIDGIDIDAESGMPSNVYIETFIKLARSIKSVIGSKPLTYTCYQGIDGYDGQILQAIKNDLAWIQLMSYFSSFPEMINLYNDYKNIMGDNICIGVKAGSPDITPLSEVSELAAWNPNKKGMMLWTINRDVPYYTNKPQYSWAKTIYKNLVYPEEIIEFKLKRKKNCCCVIF